MKRILLICLFVSGIVGIKNAGAQKVYYGPKAGMNFSSLGKDELDQNSWSMSAHGGGFVGYPINSWLSLETELYLSGKRKNYTMYENKSLIQTFSQSFFGSAIADSTLLGIGQFINDTVYGVRTGRVNMTYLELPVMASVRIKNLSIGVGPYFSLLRKATTKESFSQKSAILDLVYNLIDSIPGVGPILKGIVSSQFPGYPNPVVTESTDKGNYSPFDVGLVVNANYFMENNFTVGVRYVQGFVNYRDVPLKKNDYNTTVMFSLGYKFGAKASGSREKKKYDIEKKAVD